MCPDNTYQKKKFMVQANDIHYPGQTNHDACFIPECVRQYNGEPLYILVAHWCLLQQDWVQRSQISEAFHITARRASYLMSYLRNKASRVVCVCRRQTLSNKVQRYEIFVVRVLENPEPA
ncbi:CaiF/GrlA family transcriptional regulator, partial [Salmonella enterica]|nr:CaiF/GrlA family transcriptional regulator [Salmonella enterica]